MKKPVFIMLVLVPIGLIGGALHQWCCAGRPTECSFARIKPGMSLEEVQRILGPGREVADAPQTATKRVVNGRATFRVVEGDRFFVWNDGEDDAFWISFTDDKVGEKSHEVLPLF